MKETKRIEDKRIEDKVFGFIEEYGMLSPGCRVIAGVSGGADSVCLLFMLLEWARRRPLSIGVVHVNHGIREEAEEDARYVEDLCAQNGLPFYLEKADVRGKALREKISEEEAGRLVRYEAFRKAALSFGADRIAVAHNANDRAETMLFHLFRGTGITGLCGIRPVREQIIRPILCLERAEVEGYLRGREIPFCTDKTNEEDDYTRNRIRHHILPVAEEEVFRGCVSHMGRTADMLMETEDYLQEQTMAAMAGCVREDGKRFLVDVLSFRKLHSVIRGRLMYFLLKRLSPSEKDIAYIHVRDVLGLFEKEGNRMVCLPYGILGRRQYGEVVLEKGQKGSGADAPDGSSCGDIGGEIGGEICGKMSAGNQGPGTPADGGMGEYTVNPSDIPPQGLVVNLMCPGSGGIPAELPSGTAPQTDTEVCGCISMEFTVFSSEKTENIPQNRYTKWFDYDKIKKSLIIRPRRSGDYLTIRGKDHMAHKLLKDYMITEKIPRERRDFIPLLAEEDHILWVAGYRISEYYQISENTKRILQVQLRRSRESGGMEETNGGTNQGAAE